MHLYIGNLTLLSICCLGAVKKWRIDSVMRYRSLKLNAILNGIKQCCTIIFPLITFPYVSQVLGNAGYGKYSFSQSITSYFIVLAALGVNTYAIREGAKIRDDEKKITEFCSQVFSINVCSSIVALLNSILF